MTLFKKTISIVLAVLLLASVCVTPSFAAETDVEKTGGGGPSIFVNTDSKSHEIFFDHDGTLNNDAVAGVTYDKDNNVLSLNNATLSADSQIDIYNLGTDFRLSVTGECSAGVLNVYDSALNIVGDGTLTLSTTDSSAIKMNTLMYEHYDMSIDVGEEVTLNLMATSCAVNIKNTTHDDGDTIMTVGKKRAAGYFNSSKTSETASKTLSGVTLEQVEMYKVKNSSEPDTFFVAKEYSWGSLGVFRACYDDTVGGYVYDTEKEDYLSESEFKKKGYEFDGEKESSTITCTSVDKREMDLYEDGFGNQYGSGWDGYYTLNENKKISLNGKEYSVFELVEDEITSELSPVTYDFWVCEYQSTDKQLNVVPNVRGKIPAIYLDSDQGETVVYDLEGPHSDSSESVWYNPKKNILTLNSVDLTDSGLAVYGMGDDFRLCVSGECALKSITVYDGSITVYGGGSLTVSGAEYGISVEPLGRGYANSKLEISGETTTVDISGSTAAFRVLKSTAGDNAAAVNGVPVSGLVKSDEMIFTQNRKVEGAYLEEWTGGVGFRYKVVKKDDPDGVYVAQYSTTTHMDNYGRPSYTVENYDLKKCRYDETAKANIIVESLGVLNTDEFEEQGYSRIAGSSYYTGYQMSSAYYLRSTKADAYSDTDGNLYVVMDGKAYSFSQDNTVTVNDKELVLFESSDKAVSELTDVMENISYYSYAYDGKNFVNVEDVPPTEPAPETEPVTETGGATETVKETETVTETNKETEAETETETETETESGSGTLPHSDYGLWVAGVPVNSGNADNITGSGISGKASYDPASNTLTLTDAAISDYFAVGSAENDYTYVAGIYSTNDLNVVLNGRNTIRHSSDNSPTSRIVFYGMILRGKSLTLSGGTLLTDGILCGKVTIAEDAVVDSEYSVESSSMSNTVNASLLVVNGTLRAKTSATIREYPTVDAYDITVGKNGVIEIDKSVDTGVFISINGWIARPAAAINLGGAMTVNGTVSVKSDALAPASTSSGKAVKIGYGIYAANENASVIVNNTCSLVSQGNRNAFGGGLAVALAGDNFEIKGGSSAESAETKTLDDTKSDLYVSIKSLGTPETETVTDKQTETVTDKQTETATDPKETETVTDKPIETATDPKETETVTDKPIETATDPKETVTDKPTETATDPAETEPSKVDISEWLVEGIVDMVYTGKVLKQDNILVSNDGEYADFTVKYKNNVKAGTATVTIKGIGDYIGEIIASFKILKAKNPMTVKVNSKTVKAKTLKNKAVTVKKAITVKKSQGAVSYKAVKNSASKGVSITKKGVIKIKKGVYSKKSTLKITVKVTAKGNGNYKMLTKKVTVKIKVK